MERPPHVRHRHRQIVDLDLDHLPGWNAVRFRHRHESGHVSVPFPPVGVTARSDDSNDEEEILSSSRVRQDRGADAKRRISPGPLRLLPARSMRSIRPTAGIPHKLGFRSAAFRFSLWHSVALFFHRGTVDKPFTQRRKTT